MAYLVVLQQLQLVGVTETASVERLSNHNKKVKQANQSRGGEALPGSILFRADIGLCSLTKAPVPSASSTLTRTLMPFRRARCAHLTSCGNGIRIQMPRAQAVNGYIFVTMSSNDPSLRNVVAAMSTIARSVLNAVMTQNLEQLGNEDLAEVP